MKKHYLFITVSIWLIFTTTTFCQAIAKPVDPVPMSRPVYFSTIAIHKGDSDKALKIIADTLKKFGYSDIHTDKKEYKIEAQKFDTKDSRNYCKILIWFERDFQEPEKLLKVFLLCGRYEYIIAEISGCYKVVLTDSLEKQYFGKLKNSIESISQTY